jgi:hypothetical protein
MAFGFLAMCTPKSLLVAHILLPPVGCLLIFLERAGWNNPFAYLNSEAVLVLLFSYFIWVRDSWRLIGHSDDVGYLKTGGAAGIVLGAMLALALTIPIPEQVESKFTRTPRSLAILVITLGGWVVGALGGMAAFHVFESRKGPKEDG